MNNDFVEIVVWSLGLKYYTVVHHLYHLRCLPFHFFVLKQRDMHNTEKIVRMIIKDFVKIDEYVNIPHRWSYKNECTSLKEIRTLISSHF